MSISLILIWLVLCFVVAYAANERGRSNVGFWFLSFFLSPLVGFLTLIAMPQLPKRNPYYDPQQQLPRLERVTPKFEKTKNDVPEWWWPALISTGALFVISLVLVINSGHKTSAAPKPNVCRTSPIGAPRACQ